MRVRCSLLTQQEGFLTLRVMSRPGRVTKVGQVYTIVRNLLGDNAANDVGRIRLLPAARNSSSDDEVGHHLHPLSSRVFCHQSARDP